MLVVQSLHYVVEAIDLDSTLVSSYVVWGREAGGTREKRDVRCLVLVCVSGEEAVGGGVEAQEREPDQDGRSQRGTTGVPRHSEDVRRVDRFFFCPIA